jgi:hypothetical protein
MMASLLASSSACVDCECYVECYSQHRVTSPAAALLSYAPLSCPWPTRWKGSVCLRSGGLGLGYCQYVFLCPRVFAIHGFLVLHNPHAHAFHTPCSLVLTPTQLEALPAEILRFIVDYLPTSTLKHVALVSQTLNQHATDVLWQNVCLVDKRRLHADMHARPEPLLDNDRGPDQSDEHDDTPIIQKLFILAAYVQSLPYRTSITLTVGRNPILASKVHSLTHRCHLPSPNIFDELPRIHCDSETLSQDGRLHVLLNLAIRNMVNLHTLRIVYGHMRLASALVAGIFHRNRQQQVPLRKLWLENCCLSPSVARSLSLLNLSGLESLRLRRVDAASLLATPRDLNFQEFRPSRGGTYVEMHDGAGNWAPTTVQISRAGTLELPPHYSDAELMAQARAFDAVVWEELPEAGRLVASHPEVSSHEVGPYLATESPMQWLSGALASTFTTLTSLNLDWVLWRRKEPDSCDRSKDTLTALAALKFPHLRAFQIRNAVLQQTKLPDDVFLLEDTFLGFMEYHSKLQCLAWPLDKFYSHTKPSLDVRNRILKLIAQLANMLTELRVDAQYAGYGEPVTDTSHALEDVHECIRRRRFIAEFAPHMRHIERIKLEGGIPRDEKREILRALHWCPLKKIVMIGVSYPVGNTWGPQGLNLKQLDEGSNWEDIHNLEEEDLQGIQESYKQDFLIPQHFEFEPSYGWPAQPPLLQTIAMHHASTVTELKICGYNGCPILSKLTPITHPLLIGLRQFHNLRQLVMSFWLLTWHESSYRDTEIIKFWMDSRSPASTALVVVTPPRRPSHDPPVEPAQFPVFDPQLPVLQGQMAPPQEFNRWAVKLKTLFSPSALAYRVATDISPYLSPDAKSRPGGVRMRASFCLGDRDQSHPASDIFDLDMRIGMENEVLEFTGPREEGEKGRWWQKLESRRWF